MKVESVHIPVTDEMIAAGARDFACYRQGYVSVDCAVRSIYLSMESARLFPTGSKWEKFVNARNPEA